MTSAFEKNSPRKNQCSHSPACPPDDCGGIDQYYYWLDVLNDKKHPEYKDIKSWVPGGFKADRFDIRKINKQLSGIASYIIRWRKRNLNRMVNLPGIFLQ